MSIVTVRFDAKGLTKEVSKILNRKIQSLSSQPDVYQRLLELFYTYAIVYFPEDTGALKKIGEGLAKSGYFRHPIGRSKFDMKHGIEFGAVEERPKGLHYYAEPVLEGLFGNPVSQGIVNMMKADGSWKMFCEEAAEIIAEGMNNG